MSLGGDLHGGDLTVLDWLVALVALALAAIHVYLGATVDRPQFFVVGALFVLGVFFFFSKFWRAMLYLLAAVYTASLGILWVLGGMKYAEIGILTGILSVVFIGLAIYLFFRDSELPD